MSTLYTKLVAANEQLDAAESCFEEIGDALEETQIMSASVKPALFAGIIRANAGRGGTKDYNELSNLPTYKGEVISGETSAMLSDFLTSADVPETATKALYLVNDAEEATTRVHVDRNGTTTVEKLMAAGYRALPYIAGVCVSGDYTAVLTSWYFRQDDPDELSDIVFRGDVQDNALTLDKKHFGIAKTYKEEQEYYATEDFEYDGLDMEIRCVKLTEPVWVVQKRLISDTDAKTGMKLSQFVDDLDDVKWADSEHTSVNIPGALSAGGIRIDGENTQLTKDKLVILQDGAMVNVGGASTGYVKVGPNLYLIGEPEAGKSEIWIDGNRLVIATPEGTSEGQTLKAVKVVDTAATLADAPLLADETGEDEQYHIEWQAVDSITKTSQLSNDSGYTAVTFKEW